MDIAKRAKKQRSELSTYDQTDADLSQAQQKFGYLKELANDVRLDPTNSKGFTNVRDLWPKLFYLLYFFFILF